MVRVHISEKAIPVPTTPYLLLGSTLLRECVQYDTRFVRISATLNTKDKSERTKVSP